MIDIQILRSDPQRIKKAALAKKIDLNVDHILEIDAKKRELQQEVQQLQQDKNRYAKEQNIEKGKEIKSTLTKKEEALRAVDEELQLELYKIPKPASEDVKVGKDESENDVVKKFKEPTKFDFTPKDHMALGEALDIIDVKTAAKVSGARFTYLKGDGALLEYALLQLAQEVLLQEGFSPIIPPVLIRTDTMKQLGYMENGGDEDMFHIEKDDLVLVGTAEHALVPMLRDTVVQKKDLPL